MRRSMSSLMVVAGLLIAACGGHPLAPPSTLGSGGRVAAPSPLAVPSTAPASSIALAPTTIGVDELALSPDGPWRRVETAPGVRTPGLVYELVPSMWVWLPVQEDVRHGITWTFNRDDRPVIEAYLQARLTIVRSASALPIDYSDPGWARWFLDGGAAFRRILQVREREGERYSLDRGVVLRPVVYGEERTADTAVVVDCTLDGGLWLRPDGTPGEGTSRGIAPVGIATRVRRVAGEWRIEHLAPQPEACQ